MFLSLVRPESISSPITSSAAVTAPWGTDGSAMLILAWRREEAVSYPAIAGDARSSRLWGGQCRGLQNGLRAHGRRVPAPHPHRQTKAQRADPAAARTCRSVDQPEGDQRDCERDNHVGEVAAQAQRQPPPACRNRQPGEICNQWPGQPAGALRGKVERHAEAEE